MLYSIVKDPVTSASDLNDDLETINRWAQQWKMEFNPDPNKQATELLFSTKNKSPHYPSLLQWSYCRQSQRTKASRLNFR